MGAAVKPVVTGWRPKGRSTGQARVRRLRERLETETDPRVIESIKAQLRALAPRTAADLDLLPNLDRPPRGVLRRWPPIPAESWGRESAARTIENR